MVRRADDSSAGQGQEKARDVGVGADLAGGDDDVAVGDSHHHLVKGPVAEFAEVHPVADIVVPAAIVVRIDDLLHQRQAGFFFK